MTQRLLVKGADIVTMDAALGDLPAGDILVENGAIARIGASLPADGARIIDASDMIALPGIIDAHNCLWQTILRGYVPDLWQDTYFPRFLPLRRHFRPADNFNAAYVGGFEMLSYGTTTVVDYCHCVLGPGYAEASLAGLAETGIRRVFTYSFMSAQPDLFGAPEKRYADARRIHDAFHNLDSLTTINFGVDSLGAPDLPRQLAFARDLAAPSCIHVNAAGVITEMHRQGLLGRDLLVIHGNLLSNEELALMKAAGMAICFTPSADVQGKPADVVRRALDAGVEVVFGCDVPCHVASDPIMQLRIMFNVQGFLDGAMARSFNVIAGHRPKPRPGLPLLPRDLLAMATIGAARVLGLDDRIGSLTPGKRADILLVRKGPFGGSIAGDPCTHVMLHTGTREIDTVIVDGDIRLQGGALRDYDPARAAAMIAESRRHILDAGHSAR